MRWEAWILVAWFLTQLTTIVAVQDVKPRVKAVYVPLSLGLVWLAMRLGGAL